MLISIKNKPLIAVIALFLLIIVAGEALIYAVPHHDISAEAIRNGDVAEYSFDTDLNIAYQVVSMDNSTNKTTRYVAFYDENYTAYYRPDVLPSIEWLQKCMLKNSMELTIVNLEELNTLVLTNDTETAVIFATGILPYSIYKGSPDDPIFQWLENGGMMYWLGNSLGAEYFDENSIKHKVENSDMLFYGSSDVTREHDFKEGSVFNNDMVEGSLSDLTRQYYNECTFGLDVSKLSTEYLTLDYNLEGYYAVTFMKYHSGSGTLVVFGGGLNKYAIGADVAMTVAQTLACRTTYDSTIVDYVYGDNAKGASGTVECLNGDTDVFMFVGTGDLIYGKNITL